MNLHGLLQGQLTFLLPFTPQFMLSLHLIRSYSVVKYTVKSSNWAIETIHIFYNYKKWYTLFVQRMLESSCIVALSQSEFLRFVMRQIKTASHAWSVTVIHFSIITKWNPGTEYWMEAVWKLWIWYSSSWICEALYCFKRIPPFSHSNMKWLCSRQQVGFLSK
jgi:hypothetical protein